MKSSPPSASYLGLLGVILTLSAIIWSLQGGISAPILDCDETFNYMEALHYYLHGTGMQTWEYAPQYGLRSWFYIVIHSVPIQLTKLFVNLTKPQEVIVLRAFLHVINCLAEALLCKSISERLGSNTAWLSAVFLGLSSGMSHARRAFLPSSTCMLCFTLAQALWMRDWFAGALLSGSFSVLVSWPFSALAFIPMGVHTLVKKGFSYVIAVAAAAILLFGIIPAAVDTYFYGKPIWPTLEMILYNALGKSGGGAHLYGVEHWTYYLKNLFLNFNILWPLSILSCVFGNNDTRFYHGLPVFATMLVFQSMPHKEERFLFVIFPTISWSAAVFVAATGADRFISFTKRAIFIVLVFTLLSISRSMALARLVAPVEVYTDFFNRSNPGGVFCVGREWYRFPSSFYLPREIELRWTKSDFQGILPQPFLRKPEGYTNFVPNMNDLNKEEPSRYTNPEWCKYVADIDQDYLGNRDALRPAKSATNWKPIVDCATITDQNTTPQPFRSFAWFADKWMGTKTLKYCIYEKA